MSVWKCNLTGFWFPEYLDECFPFSSSRYLECPPSHIEEMMLERNALTWSYFCPVNRRIFSPPCACSHHVRTGVCPTCLLIFQTIVSMWSFTFCNSQGMQWCKGCKYPYLVCNYLMKVKELRTNCLDSPRIPDIYLSCWITWRMENACFYLATLLTTGVVRCLEDKLY